jgi:nucleoside-diphosphate-sugar epimerase
MALIGQRINKLDYWRNSNQKQLSGLSRIQTKYEAKERNVEGIIHTAVLFVNETNERSVDAVRVNMEGTVNVLDAVKIMGLRRAVCCSSAAAGGAKTNLDRHTREDDPPTFPLSGIYPVIKFAVEGLCHNYQTLYGISAIAIRPSRCYGPGIAPARIHYLPIDFLVNEAVKGRSIKLETGSDTVVDYTYVKDEAHGIIIAFDVESPTFCLYNISFGELRSVGQIVEVLRKLFPEQTFEVGPGLWQGWISKAEFKGANYKVAIRSPLDISKAKSDLGYQPQYGIEQGIRDYVRWLQGRAC